jgi:hypothetical protein
MQRMQVALGTIAIQVAPPLGQIAPAAVLFDQLDDAVAALAIAPRALDAKQTRGAYCGSISTTSAPVAFRRANPSCSSATCGSKAISRSTELVPPATAPGRAAPKDDKALHSALDLIRGITTNSAYPPNPKTAVPN